MRVVIIGDGGHSKVIQEMVRTLKYNIIAILDDKYKNSVRNVNDITYAPISELDKLIDSDVFIVVAIGDNKIRRNLVQKTKKLTKNFLTIIHPKAVISPTAKIGDGTVIMPKAVVNADAIIEDHCIINTGAIIEHDNKICEFAHISPSATLAGNVEVGSGTHLGAASTIIPGIVVGSWSVIGAGSTVIRNIPSYCKAVGSPTRIIEYLEDEVEVRLGGVN